MRVEWPTVALIAATYAAWGVALFWLPAVSLPLAIAVAALAVAQHGSLTHEAIHGHPTSHGVVNAALVGLPLTLLVPFGRFRDTHLAHHRDARLTDPYDDPESHFWAEADLARQPAVARRLLAANNTLAGRMILGPALGTALFVAGDLRARDRAIASAWAAHLPALSLTLAVMVSAPMPLWAGLAAAYIGLGLLKIRTYLEHRAEDHAAERSVVIEDRGPLSWLFLNNNLHAVHHMHPGVAWYRLPALYARDPARYLRRNGNYRYASYAQVFRRHLLRAKDPVAHPLWYRLTK